MARIARQRSEMLGPAQNRHWSPVRQRRSPRLRPTPPVDSDQLAPDSLLLLFDDNVPSSQSACPRRLLRPSCSAAAAERSRRPSPTAPLHRFY
ncbi:hypothetical protein SCP_0403820 [Sparassis crispa]|uniref:Uncharacterized protein n=1 Tax=Sparassis crispa TaxID=139825 RepID=A0A401GIJ2_9APHY|nr:hypothetical protein SCP_0403820 [Sparassis crispa]GBE82006.1 hypothetical protein SCP_0403820 [Sparassis crispa]